MGPKRGAGVSDRGRVRRGRGSRMPRSSRGGHRGTTLVPSSSSSEEGFWHYDFLLCILSCSAARIPLPPAFAAIVSELNLSGLLLRLQGCVRSPSWIELEIDRSRVIFLGSGWKSFSWRLNLRDGDTICCRFNGEDTLTIRAFDPSGNRLDPYWQETSSDSSGGSRSPSSSSPVASSSGDSSGGACSSSSKEDLNVKPPVKRARQATLYNWRQ